MREREANGQAFNSPLNTSHPHFKSDYEKRVNEMNDIDHNQTNPFVRQIPKLTHKLSPFTKLNTKLYDCDEPVYANSHIPIAIPKENIHRQRIPINPPAEIYNGNAAYPTVTYDDQYPNDVYKSPYNTATSSVNKEKKSNGTKTTSDDPGKNKYKIKKEKKPHILRKESALKFCFI